MATYYAKSRWARDLIPAVKPLPTEADENVSERDELYWRFWAIDIRYKILEQLGEDGEDMLIAKLRSFPPHNSQKEYYTNLKKVAARLASNEEYRDHLDEHPGAWPNGSW